MGGKSKKKITTFATPDPIGQLSCNHVDAKPITVSGWFGDGDAGEEWAKSLETEETFYESQRCETCGEILTFAGGHSGGKHRDVWEDSANHDPDADESDLTCDGHVGACEGPMMNYAYPCDWKDGEETARALVDLPLVPVVMADGTHALALTGGGMDLSWEICEAYVRLGFLPPLHHCSDLPRYVDRRGRAERQTLVLDAATRTAEVAEGWARRAKERIAETRTWIAPESRRIARAKGKRS